MSRSDSSTLEKPRASAVAWCGVGSVLRRRVQGLWVQYEDGDVLRRYQEEIMPEWSLAVSGNKR